jgi:hypothetical protein
MRAGTGTGTLARWVLPCACSRHNRKRWSLRKLGMPSCKVARCFKPVQSPLLVDRPDPPFVPFSCRSGPPIESQQTMSSLSSPLRRSSRICSSMEQCATPTYTSLQTFIATWPLLIKIMPISKRVHCLRLPTLSLLARLFNSGSKIVRALPAAAPETASPLDFALDDAQKYRKLHLLTRRDAIKHLRSISLLTGNRSAGIYIHTCMELVFGGYMCMFVTSVCFVLCVCAVRCLHIRG